MDVHMIATLIAGGGVLEVVVWVLAKVGKTLVKVAEALAAAAVVFLAVWLVIKAVLWALRQVVIHWRTSLAVVAVLAWWHCWGRGGHGRSAPRRKPSATSIATSTAMDGREHPRARIGR